MFITHPAQFIRQKLIKLGGVIGAHYLTARKEDLVNWEGDSWWDSAPRKDATGSS
ncbi:hypothetical protein [Myxococcus landrumensis]|uniref:Uncharacterized protein n=1 Tax=Myxococcus landrumensis TaxID=2813577 RepID=A0ABX7NB53_9BACT|nr:hypothetical protein [Myxococcus landrumus]QSQ15726.1 hypothetical protein JY572_06580 [Myxococcus landrumus]